MTTMQTDWTIAESMRRPMEEFRELLDGLAGQDLLGLTVFGPILSPDFDQYEVSASSVMVLQKVDLLMLRRLSEHGPHLGRLRIAAPLIMTPAYIQASLDTFPLELLDIHQHHQTLRGTDYFERLDFQPNFLRLQCEHEFKRVLIRLRQGLLASAGRDDFLDDIEHDVGLHLLRNIRGLLWLEGRRHYLPVPEALAACEELVGRSLSGIKAALDPKRTCGWDEFVVLYQDAETLAHRVDEKTARGYLQ